MRTDDEIAAALERTRLAVCTPRERGCFALPYTAEQAKATGTAEGWQKIGWIAADGGQRAWDVWFNVTTGEGQLRKLTKDR